MELDEYSSSNTAAVRSIAINSASMNTKVVVASGSASWNSNDTGETTASMRIFTSVMLHAWRQRRADVQRLKCVVERLQKSVSIVGQMVRYFKLILYVIQSMQTKNELHVCNTLIRVEQRRCSELQLELKKSNMNIKHVRNSCEALNKSVATLTADKQELEEELHLNKKECHEFEHKMRKCKDELLTALLDQRGLQHQLSQEQQLVGLLNKEKKQLLDEVTQHCNNETEFKRREKILLQELEQKVQRLHKLSSMIEKLEQKLKEITK